MTGAELKACREAYGWRQTQVARATGYDVTAPYCWEHGRSAVPASVVAWVATLPPVAASGAYPPTAAGLRIYMHRKRMRCIELADFCGAAESTVERWLTERSQLPLAVRAWLAAGAPPYWRWEPPGIEPNVIRLDSKPVGHRAALRPIGHQRALGSRVINRWARAAQPRPRRRKDTAA